MSLTAFATLRSKHPGDEQSVATVEKAVVTMVQRDPTAVIDERLLEAATHLRLSLLEVFLGELVAAGALEERFALLCANGKGPAAEAELLSLLPEIVECERCGAEHLYDRGHVEVFFVASEMFVKSVLSQ